MTRTKLKKLGIDLPLLPTTSVGSLPKPEWLKKARNDFQKGAVTREQLRQKEEEATRFWIQKQGEIDIDILVDGEMYRGDMVAYFAETLEGFEQGGFVRSYGNRYYRKPVIVRPVKWKGPITADWWRFAQRQTVRPVKGMLTGPYTIMDWSFNEHYPDRRTATLAIAKEIRKEVEALVEAGAKIIQIDEPALSVRPEELPFAREALEICIKDLQSYFITHICYGAFEFIYPEMLSLPFDNFDLELSNSELDLLSLFRKDPFTKDLTAGVVDVHSHRIEDQRVVRKKIEAIGEVLPVGQLWIDPDCGLKTRTEEEAVRKLQVMRGAVEELRIRTGRQKPGRGVGR
jgi:5-methyltetrahydropteroyltriglutamate--homocysteine methyltransferase